MNDSLPTIVCRSPWFEEPLPPSDPIPLVRVRSVQDAWLAPARAPVAWPAIHPRPRPRRAAARTDLMGFAVGAVCGFLCMMTLFALSLLLSESARAEVGAEGQPEHAIQIHARR